MTWLRRHLAWLDFPIAVVAWLFIMYWLWSLALVAWDASFPPNF